jgi:hypothetical protein
METERPQALFPAVFLFVKVSVEDTVFCHMVGLL